MAIPNESRSSEHLLGYSLYHVAALKADPEASHLTAALEPIVSTVRSAFAARTASEQAELEVLARYSRADFDLDEACRICELEVLAAAGKDRAQANYRAAFPKGLSALVAERGRSQADKVRSLVAELKKRLPDVAERHATKLEALAAGMIEAEEALRAAETVTSGAMNDERIGRSELVRQLHRNRGALRVLYPRNRRRVASFFPPAYSRATPEPIDDEGEEAEDAEQSAAAG